MTMNMPPIILPPAPPSGGSAARPGRRPPAGSRAGLAPGTVTGAIFFDRSGDAKRQKKELALQNIAVTLDPLPGNLAAPPLPTTADANGRFTFSALPGDWVVN